MCIEQNFTIHCRVAETEKFLDKLLPVPPTTINAILRSMKVQKLYDSQTQRWVGFADPILPEGDGGEYIPGGGEEEETPGEVAVWPFHQNCGGNPRSGRNCRSFYLENGQYEIGRLPHEIAEEPRQSRSSTTT